MSEHHQSGYQTDSAPVQEAEEKDRLLSTLNQARDNIHWELDSPVYDFVGFEHKLVLRFSTERRKWALCDIDANTGEVVRPYSWWFYFKRYEDAVKDFKLWCLSLDLDPTKVKRTKIVFNTR